MNKSEENFPNLLVIKKLLIVFCRKSRLRMIRELVFPQKFAVFGAKMVAEAENFEAAIVSKLSDWLIWSKMKTEFGRLLKPENLD